MKLQPIHQRVRSKPLVLTGIVLAFVVAAIWVGVYRLARPMAVSIVLHDAASGAIVSDGYTVSAGQDKDAKLDNGQFKFEAVGRDAEISISGPGLYSPVKFNIDNRRNIDVSINAGLNNAIEPFVRSLQLRQYRKIYDMMAKAEKAKIGVDIFLKKMNDWQDGFISRNLAVTNIGYRIEPESIKRTGSLSGTDYTGVTKIILTWDIAGGAKDYNPETTIYFVTEEGQTRWLYETDFLP